MSRTRLDIRRTGAFPGFTISTASSWAGSGRIFAEVLFFMFIDFKFSWCMVFSDGGSWFFVSLFPAFSPRRDFRTLHLQAVAWWVQKGVEGKTACLGDVGGFACSKHQAGGGSRKLSQ
jgi:hypothetical protein